MDASKYIPTDKDPHPVWNKPPTNVPAAHEEQPVDDSCCNMVLYVPSAHPEHASEVPMPMLVLYEPAAHMEQPSDVV